MRTKMKLLLIGLFLGITVVFAQTPVVWPIEKAVKDSVKESYTQVIVIKNIESVGDLMKPAIVICNEKGEIRRLPQLLFTEKNFDLNLKNLTKILNEYYKMGYKLVGTTVTGQVAYVTEYILEKK